MLTRLTDLSLRAPRRLAAVWLVVLVVGVGAAGVLFSTLDADLDGASSFESERVNRLLDDLDPGGGDVVAVVDGAAVDDAVLDDLRATSGIDAVNTLPSDDGRATAVQVELAAGLGDDAHEDLVGDVEDDLRAIDAPTVVVGGELLLDDEIAELAEKDAQRAEMISLPIVLVVMAVVFGGVLAAGLPLAVALSGAGATLLALVGISSLTDVSLYAVNVTLMLGIGLGIDYGLLVISRFREERGAGYDVPEALHRTMATAGRTVVFSAATVAVSLVALAVFPDPTVRSLAYRRRRRGADHHVQRGHPAAGAARLGRTPPEAGGAGVRARLLRPAGARRDATGGPGRGAGVGGPGVAGHPLPPRRASTTPG